MSRPLLILGPPLGSGLEVLETAELLGFKPIVVLSSEPREAPAYEFMLIDKLPTSLRSAPIYVLGEMAPPEMARQRLDRRWMASVSQAISRAVGSGLTNWATLVHPSAHVSPSATIGAGVFAGPLATISSGANVGDFASIGRAASLGHHSRLGTRSRLGPGVIVPGNVTLGDEVVVGPGTTFINGIRVTNGVLIGSGSVVTRHIRRPQQVMGNPARPLRRPVALLRRWVKRGVREALRKVVLYEKVRSWYRSRFG